MSLYLAREHPLAEVAARHCVGHLRPLVGGVACGQCWERAIRDDERIVVEHELPRELAADAELVDPIAVARAVSGQQVSLTSAERRLIKSHGRRAAACA